MELNSIDHLPSKITVKQIASSRYEANQHQRPLIWDERRDGIDVVVSDDNRKIKLLSTGQQSPPQEGWVILLTSGSSDDGYEWTLYGLPRGAGVDGIDCGMA